MSIQKLTQNLLFRHERDEGLNPRHVVTGGGPRACVVLVFRDAYSKESGLCIKAGQRHQLRPQTKRKERTPKSKTNQ